ncbi:hypothetical protein [Candidatus Pyrohabitans sp.]
MRRSLTIVSEFIIFSLLFLSLPAAHAFVLDYTFEWNGKYWLIASVDWHNATGINGEYRLVRYDGSNFVLVKYERGNEDLLAKTSYIAWNGRYWLLGGRNTLWKYDGKEITDLSGKLNSLVGNWSTVHYIGWGERYWLIIIHSMSEDSDKIVVYEDNSGFKTITAGYDFKYLEIKSVVFNSDYWLIGANYGKLLKYDGEKIVDLSDKIGVPEDFSTAVTNIAFNGTSWLIVINGAFKGKYAVYGEKVLEYNGYKFTDLTEIFNRTELKPVVTGVNWDPSRKYWVITGGNGIIGRYFNGSFTVLAEMSELYPLPWEGFGISDVVYNPEDKYWLIAGYKAYFHPSTPRGVIMRFDREKLYDITPYDIFSEIGHEFTVDEVKLNGDYWLISADGKFLMYDGSAFEDLTYQVLSLTIQPAKMTQKESRTAEEEVQTKKKTVCGPLLILLISLFSIITLWNRHKFNLEKYERR